MATTKRKSIIDASDLSKRARLWFSEGIDGLSSYLGLKPLDVLATEQHRKKRDWVGAYPGMAGQKDQYIRGVLMKGQEQENLPVHHRLTASSLSINGVNSVGEGKPYQLEPYTKVPSFTAPDFREQSSPRSGSPLPTSYGRGSSGSDRASSPSDESPSHSTTTHGPQHSWRFGASVNSRFDQSTLLRARPRIYASKAQRTTSLLQSKYNKDESLARQRLFERYNQAHTKPEQSMEAAMMQSHVVTYLGRLQAALDATIGALRSDRESYMSSRKDSFPSIEDEVAEHRRIRAYNRSFDRDELDIGRISTSRQPAWMKTKYQGNKEPTWLRNVRNLINRNIPSIEQQPRPPGHQAIVSEHERIEKELAARRKPTQFTPLTKEDEQRIAVALADGVGEVAEGFNVSVLKKDIHTLRPGQWLNDEVINFYGNLIMARSKESTTLPKVHVFSTFFYKTLSENGYDKVRRWTKKVKIFEMDYVLMPIHRSGNHWTTAAIDMKKKRISYYDSLLGNNPKCFLILRNYLEQESMDKLKKPFDFEGWENDCPKDIPTQENGFDCGVFTCTFIEFMSRGQDQLEFSQENMPYLRKKIVLSIINKSL
ncbi:SUMO1 sentrin specific peptidase 1 [Entomortierella chlamydospora]|uniref:SUMO1 sentrin specific peptidase 1 n=1 Tax=Entomortierella chlamydospora TaxID=101097 RepID=A0A9P6N4F6_9FUNG|nr:SUMO1 sentrin specific peptidase 1 [Entomortierella chlamydospora]KAG0024744.1 SUMO1 sentrin specific peptidase 1 [Entomortierella chlamydospora]